MFFKCLIAIAAATIPLATGSILGSQQLLNAQTAGTIKSPGIGTWYVCQGYNGKISHTSYDRHALDLTVAPNRGASGYCYGDQNISAGKSIYAPASGKVTYRKNFRGKQDMLCLALNSGGSLLIGHMDYRVSNGQQVQPTTLLGKVSSAEDANGQYAHIHIRASKTSDCSGESVPFTYSNKFRIEGTDDLLDNGTPNQHAGRVLTR